MDTGIYVALSKQIGIFRDMEVSANNIANVDTSGYQSEKLLFSDYLVPSTKQEQKVSFSNEYTTFRDTQQGTLKITNSPLDAAIEGSGYFAVQTPLGVRYTRNGNFRTNQDGMLVSKEGYTVLDESSQPIQLDELDRVVQIRADGSVNVDGTERAKLKVVEFDNEQLLHRVGNTMYSSEAAPKPATNFKIVNGALERSNVQSFAALTHLLATTRSASDSATFISTMFTLERKASDSLAKIYS